MMSTDPSTSALPKFVLPGDVITKKTSSYTCGSGTYERLGYVCASLAGMLKIQSGDGADPSRVLHVEHPSGRGTHRVPVPGAIVVATVTAISPRFCKCSITHVEETRLKSEFAGLIRKEDVRRVDRDGVQMQHTYRPGDTILGRVLTMGDAQSYLLTTAEPELGVVRATCQYEHEMRVSSEKQLRCETCNVTEERKIAQVPLQVAV